MLQCELTLLPGCHCTSKAPYSARLTIVWRRCGAGPIHFCNTSAVHAQLLCNLTELQDRPCCEHPSCHCDLPAEKMGAAPCRKLRQGQEEPDRFPQPSLVLTPRMKSPVIPACLLPHLGARQQVCQAAHMVVISESATGLCLVHSPNVSGVPVDFVIPSRADTCHTAYCGLHHMRMACCNQEQLQQPQQQ